MKICIEIINNFKKKFKRYLNMTTRFLPIIYLLNSELRKWRESPGRGLNFIWRN